MSTVNVRLSLPEDSSCELFHSETKLTPYQVRRWKYQQAPVSEHPAIAKWMQAPFKEYLSLPQIELPRPAAATEASGQPDAACLAALLQQPADITSLELYLQAHKIKGLAPGLYHYNKRTHCLETFSGGSAWPQKPLRQEMPSDLAALLFINGVFTRVRLKHGERGYRYMLVEAGRVLERMLAAAARLCLSLEPMSDFFDDAVNELLGVDGVEESALFLAGLRR